MVDGDHGKWWWWTVVVDDGGGWYWWMVVVVGGGGTDGCLWAINGLSYYTNLGSDQSHTD